MSEGSPLTYVFDIHPLLSYARSDGLFVPSLVATSLQRNQHIAVSTVTLAHAYRELSEGEALVLDMLAGGQLAAAFVMTPLGVSAARDTGRRARKFGLIPSPHSLSTLHAADIAERDVATVVTGDGETVRSILGPDWPILEV